MVRKYNLSLGGALPLGEDYLVGDGTSSVGPGHLLRFVKSETMLCEDWVKKGQQELLLQLA